jgi:hypothetical protein
VCEWHVTVFFQLAEESDVEVQFSGIFPLFFPPAFVHGTRPLSWACGFIREYQTFSIFLLYSFILTFVVKQPRAIYTEMPRAMEKTATDKHLNM